MATVPRDRREFLPPVDLSPVPEGWLDGEVAIDLGCGAGTFLAGEAARYPDRHFIGVERLLDRYRRTHRRVMHLPAKNAVVVRADTLSFLEVLPAASVAHLHLLFPDPWPKRRHHHRRMVQQPFLKEAHRVLRPDGWLDLVTDHAEYFLWMERELAKFSAFERQQWPQDPGRPRTDFEQRFLARGQSIHTMRMKKLSAMMGPLIHTAHLL